jgi:Ran GTPase-activating protein (RanGAP) involved in mRNA processing and transport
MRAIANIAADSIDACERLGRDETLEIVDLTLHAPSRDDLEKLASALEAAAPPRLHTLVLARTRLDGAAAHALTRALRTHAPLRALGLDACFLGDAGILALVGALAARAPLAALSLRGNAFGEAGARALAALCASHGAALRTLSVGENALGAGVAPLCDALGALELEHVCFYATRCDARGAAAFARLLKKSRTLVSANLNSNDVGDAGAVAIAHALTATRAPLRRLALEAAAIGDAGARALAAALLGSDAPLETLQLALNPAISGVGAAALVDACEARDVNVRATADGGVALLFATIGREARDVLARYVRVPRRLHVTLSTAHLGAALAARAHEYG